MARKRSRMAARIRRGLGLRPTGGAGPGGGGVEAPAEEPTGAGQVAAGQVAADRDRDTAQQQPRGLGEPPSGPREQAGEAELDTLRGELVRELDRMADGDHGSASFRRMAS